MSEHTANILFKLGGYHLDCRGEREVKVCHPGITQLFVYMSVIMGLLYSNHLSPGSSYLSEVEGH